MKFSAVLPCVLFLILPRFPTEAVGAAVEAPNVVLVMADDQGWGDMAYNGHPHLQTPNFDAFAREGVRFDRFYAAAPVCSPTRGSVMTGRTPNRFGCFRWGHSLRPQEITIAEALKAAGYRTGHFGKWHLGSVQKASPVSPGASGFDVWVSSPNFFDLDPILSDQGTAVPFKGDSSDITVDSALKFIRECAAKRNKFLAVVWFGSPHSPHQSLEADRQIYSDRPVAEQDFLGEITAMDRAFGRLRTELHELGIRDNTILWYCSDNGALPKLGSSGDRRGRKGAIYEGGLLVPSLLEWPARVTAPFVVQAPCVTSDIYPTVLEFTGTKPDIQPPLDGVSLAGLLNRTTNERARPIGFWDYPARGIGTPAKLWMEELYAAQRQGQEPNDPSRLFSDAAQIKEPLPLDRFPGHAAWLDGFWKLHRMENATNRTVKWELYDLASDPQESRNLIEEQPDRCAELRAGLERWLESVARSLNGEDYAAPDRSDAKPTAGELDEKFRRLLLGTWEDDYQGKRMMTVREDGTGVMVVQLSGLKARLYASRLEFDMKWSIENGRLKKQTIGGRPPGKVSFILKMMGDRVDEPILELTKDRLLLLDANGKTKYDWRRVKDS